MKLNRLSFSAWGLLLLMAFAFPRPALAVRPFVTDDARVVGNRLFLLETSLRRDKTRFQNMNLLAYGPTERLELTMGFTDGIALEGDDSGRMSVAGPMVQGKYLFTEGIPYGLPGVAVVAGAGTPYGSNNFGNPSWSGFTYVALTEALGANEAVLIHANIGINYARPDDRWKYTTTWGIGTQIHLIGGLHGVAEVFYGDPYVGDTGGAYQAGFRHFISERIQVDATVGSGLWGDNKPESWIGCGLRVIFDPF